MPLEFGKARKVGNGRASLKPECLNTRIKRVSEGKKNEYCLEIFDSHTDILKADLNST